MPARGNAQGNQQGNQVQPVDPQTSMERYHKGLSYQTSFGYKHVENLKEAGYDRWKKSLETVSKSLKWNTDLMKPYDPADAADQPGFQENQESTIETLNRNAMYAIIEHSTKNGYEHLLVSADIGDARHAFNLVYDEFVSTTTGGLVSARNKFDNSSMMTEQANLSEFISLIMKRAKECRRLGENITDGQMIVVLLKGLPEEFKSQRRKFQDEPIGTLTFNMVTKKLKNFARDEGLTDLTYGAKKGDRGDKAFLLHEGQQDKDSKNESQLKQEREQVLLRLKELNRKLDEDCTNKGICKFHVKGHCKKGKDCNFKHPTQRDQQRRCGYCGKDHDEEKCFKKKRDQEKKSNERKEMAAMMKEVLLEELQLRSIQDGEFKESNY